LPASRLAHRAQACDAASRAQAQDRARATVLRGGMAVAINKPVVGDPAALPVYIEIE
jgi:hypothetical protein